MKTIKKIPAIFCIFIGTHASSTRNVTSSDPVLLTRAGPRKVSWPSTVGSSHNAKIVNPCLSVKICIWVCWGKCWNHATVLPKRCWMMGHFGSHQLLSIVHPWIEDGHYSGHETFCTCFASDPEYPWFCHVSWQDLGKRHSFVLSFCAWEVVGIGRAIRFS